MFEKTSQERNQEELKRSYIFRIKKKIYSLLRRIQSLFGEGFFPVFKTITGERIQFLCDHSVGTIRDFHSNPRVKNRQNKWLQIDTLNSSFNNGPLLFGYTHLLDNQNLLVQKLSFLNNPFILIFHNSDHNFQKEHLELFDALPKLRHIFTQNMNVLDERVTPLPIGIANRMWRHGNLWLLNHIMKLKTEKTKLIFFNFSINTNREKREECYKKIQDKGIEFLPWRGVLRHWEQLNIHKYAICPEGNGIDTHRFWECLYLKVVPICKRNVLVEYFAKDFPVIILDDWAELDLQQLKNVYHEFDWKNWHKLDIETYENLLSGKVSSLTTR